MLPFRGSFRSGDDIRGIIMKKFIALALLTLAFAATVSAAVSPTEAGPRQCNGKC
jgi:hypothetical protein